ncbi:MAG: hypothetical protein M5U26_06205 [Planctomycetota bacterium]|nr:hypothetical protein [Planctomycetota bacterium]
MLLARRYGLLSILLLAALPAAAGEPGGEGTVEQAVGELRRSAQQRLLSGDLEQARALYDKALQLKPDDPESLRGVASVQAALQESARRKQHEDSLAQLREILKQAPSLDAPRDEPKAQEAARKYRMAQLALEDQDWVLAQRFLAEAFALAPANGPLRYEYAKYLAEQGQGREALALLRDLKGDADLTARAEYLAAKLQVAGTLDGEYQETSRKLFPVGEPPRSAPGAGRMSIDLGTLVWVQKANGQDVTQTFGFAADRLRAGQEHYELKPLWRGIETSFKNYRPDRRQIALSAQRGAKGWYLLLKVMDDEGNGGEIVFEPTEKKKGILGLGDK